MRYIFHFPDIGEGISEGKILAWYVEKGQRVEVGDPLVQMETDKVVADIPAPRAGVIAARFGNEGEVIQVEDPLVEIDIEGVAGEAAQELARERPRPAGQEPVTEAGYGVVGTLEVAGDGAHLPASREGVLADGGEAAPSRPVKALATPVARAMAREMGVDIDRVAGSGPGGRVTREDIRRHLSSQVEESRPADVAAPRVRLEPLTQIRKAIARNMIAAKQNAAHMTLFDEVDVGRLVALRQRHRAAFDTRGLKLTYLPFVLKATVAALQRQPVLNSQLDLANDRLIYKEYFNIGVAVDAPDGLVVPVIRGVDRLSIPDLAERLADLAERARTRRLTAEDMRDGSFTVTNYGAVGGRFGVPVINYPQAAILGVGRIAPQPVVREGELAVGQVMPLSLSVDHRIVDGGDAVRFLADVMRFLADPAELVMA